jgi:hypothetical protein
MYTTKLITICLYETDTDINQNRIQSVKFFKSSSVEYEHNAINFEISTTGPTICTVCFQFITINSLYMFQALICSSSGGTVYTTIGIYCFVCVCVCIMSAGCLQGYNGILLAANRHNMHKIYQLLYIQYLLMMSK